MREWAWTGRCGKRTKTGPRRGAASTRTRLQKSGKRSNSLAPEQQFMPGRPVAGQTAAADRPMQAKERKQRALLGGIAATTRSAEG